jgi:hypothetical protein
LFNRGINFNMETLDTMWVAAFTMLLFVILLLNNLIVNSLNAKPLGKQTLFDSAIKDAFCAMKFYGTVVCLICILARFDRIRNIFTENNFLLTIACSIYSFGFTCLVVSISLLCIIRTVSILCLTFLEETVGEKKVRLIANTLVITTGIFAVFIYNATGEINSGTPFTLITFQTAHTGRFFY